MPLENDLPPATPLNVSDSQISDPKQSNRGFIHCTPDEALTSKIERQIQVRDRTFYITHPGNPDQLLNHPSTHAAFDADEYMPYWAELWPAAHMLAQALIDRAPWPQNSAALEIGCGVGLPGVVALSLGMQVIFSDYDSAALQFAAQNARANGFTQFTTRPLDWRHPPAEQVPLILAADVIYEERNIAPLIALLQQTLTPNGICLLTDPDRSTRGGFRFALKQSSLSYKTYAYSAPDPSNADVKGTLYEIHRS